MESISDLQKIKKTVYIDLDNTLADYLGMCGQMHKTFAVSVISLISLPAFRHPGPVPDGRIRFHPVQGVLLRRGPCVRF